MKAYDVDPDYPFDAGAWAEVEATKNDGVWICLYPDIPHMRRHIEATPQQALDMAALLVRAAGYELK